MGSVPAGAAQPGRTSAEQLGVYSSATETQAKSSAGSPGRRGCAVLNAGKYSRHRSPVSPCPRDKELKEDKVLFERLLRFNFPTLLRVPEL